jgi:hypothetical protein
MKFDGVMVKICLIVLAQQLVAVFKTNYQRWVIKTHFTTGELSIFKMFSLDFLTGLKVSQVAWLFGIALFTFATFPLGVWLSSFNMGNSYPIMNMIGATINLATFPTALYMMHNVLGELEYNMTSKAGIGVIVVSKLLLILGCYLMYRGNNGAV